MNTYTPEEFAKKYFNDNIISIYDLIKQGKLQYETITVDDKTGKPSIRFSDEDYENYLNLLALNTDDEQTLNDFIEDENNLSEDEDEGLMYMLDML